MELPEINVLPVHSLFLPVQQKEFKYVPYTVDQERNILTAFDSKDIPAIVDNYKKMIDVCGNGVDYDNLTAMEFILIAVNLRSKSKGEILDITTKCEKCGLPIEFSASIEDHIVTDNADTKSDICKIDNDLSFEIIPVKMPFLYKVESIKSETDLMLETALHSINKVFWKDDIYTEFTPDTLKEKISLTYPILKKIFASSAKLIKMTLKLEIECTGKKDGLGEFGIQNGCGHKKEYIIRDFLKYLS
jgi:hypothetical protein